jgi:hypothetical protein
MLHWPQRRALVIVGVLILLGFGAFSYIRQPEVVPDDPPAPPDTLPTQLSDSEFWGMIESFSEPDGFFRSNNFLSNESGLQDVIPAIRNRIRPGGVYMGVGPEQNFTYILAFQPKISFILDIRRLNMIEHLLYKAIFELSKDRADFVSMLFSRQRPHGLTTKTSTSDLFAAFDGVGTDTDLAEANLEKILSHLIVTHGFALSQEDSKQIRFILDNFAQDGPDLSYEFLRPYYQGTLGMPSYRELMTDTDMEGHNWSFLAAEEPFRKIQDLQRRNLIVPLVGDFAGPQTLRAAGRFMKEHDAVLSVFYTSNVEMYLFQQPEDWKQFYDNVSTLPIRSSSVFIRFAAGRGRWNSQMWSPIRTVLESYHSGKIDDYRYVLGLSD